MSLNDANVIGVTKAKNSFSEILRKVGFGEEFTITIRGTPVARLVAVSPQCGNSQEERIKIIERMRQLASQNRLNGLKIKELIAEGRR